MCFGYSALFYVCGLLNCHLLVIWLACSVKPRSEFDHLRFCLGYAMARWLDCMVFVLQSKSRRSWRLMIRSMPWLRSCTSRSLFLSWGVATTMLHVWRVLWCVILLVNLLWLLSIDTNYMGRPDWFFFLGMCVVMVPANCTKKGHPDGISEPEWIEGCIVFQHLMVTNK